MLELDSPFFDFFRFFLFRKPLKVLILFLLANLAKFFAGSIPRIFLNFKSLKGLSATPSLLPTSIIYDLFGFRLNSLMYFVEAFNKMIPKYF